MGKLTKTQELFCKQFIIDLNATQSAIRTGYSKKTARSQGQRLLTKVDIQNRIRELMKSRMERLDVDADAVVQELTRIAFSDMGEFITITETGEVIPRQIDELGSSRTRLIQEIQNNKQSGLKIKLHDKLSALTTLGKHLGLFDERVTVVGEVKVHRPGLKQFNKQELRALRDILSQANKRRKAS